jgi:dihydrofolate reductase
MKKLTLIVAMTPSGIIGIDGQIPWKVPEDLRRFKALTTGHAIIMGRKTFESIGRPLPNRKNIVLSRSMDTVVKHEDAGIVACLSIDDALDVAHHGDDAPFVIGGAEIYAQTLAHATHLEVTYVFHDYDSLKPGWSTEHLPLKRDVRRFNFKNGGETPVRFGVESYPSMWDWRCTKIEHALEHPDVEFHSFERRTVRA